MSIQIDHDKCISCGRCSEVCPGSLIERDKALKAVMKYPEECWGCTACLKECPTGAVKYYLGADIGGTGGYLFTRNHDDSIDWYIISPDSTTHHIKINKKESNKY
ncbi:MAG TPA: ferredoxin family protein [Desulfobacteria bacterium]|nr:ferredoxin family protein [Desulfobacteria bacterium]